MASTPTDSSPTLQKAVLALLALTLADREERHGADETPKRNEVVLAAAGFTAREISDLTGKNYEAVKTALRRARTTKGTGSPKKKQK